MNFTEHDALAAAIEIAKVSPCAKSNRGVVIFHRRDGILASGHNHPPSPFRCDGSGDCREFCNQLCVHAELAALHDLRFNLVSRVRDLEMLHVKVINGVAVPSGPPSCWQCSREILAARVCTMWLLHDEGLRSYSSEEFHEKTLRHCKLPIARGG